MANYHYRGPENLAEWGIETSSGYQPTSAGMNGFSWLRNLNISIKDNKERIRNLGSGTQAFAGSKVKNVHEVSGNLEFWLPADIDATAYDVWFIKLGLDKFNVAHDGTKWEIPNTGSSAYGSFELLDFTIEGGMNKSGYIETTRAQGCKVKKITFKASKGEKLTVSADFIGRVGFTGNSSFINGSTTTSTARPFHWGDIDIEYGDSGNTSIRNTFTDFEVSIESDLTAETYLAESAITIDDFDDATSWTGSTDASLTDNTTTFKQSGEIRDQTSMSIAKSGATETELSASKTINAIDLSNKKISLWIYIADSATLTTLDTSAAANMYLELGTGGFTNTNQYYFGTNLSVGWNKLIFTVNNPDGTIGSGATETDIDSIKIVLKTDAATDTIVADKILVDWLRVPIGRTANELFLNTKTITGSVTVDLTTETGMTFIDNIIGSSTEPQGPTESFVPKEFVFRIKDPDDTSNKIELTIYDVEFDELPKDFKTEGKSSLTLNYTGKYYLFNIFTPDATAPTNWDQQS